MKYFEVNVRATVLIMVFALVGILPQQANAYGANEIQLCKDVAKALTIETYTDKLNEYMTEKTGAVPAWIVAEAAVNVASKIEAISEGSAAASEIGDWCNIAGEDDEVTRYFKAIEKIASKAGPAGQLVAAQMGAGLAVLKSGKIISSEISETTTNSTGEKFYCTNITDVINWWPDIKRSRAESLAAISGAYLLTRSNSDVAFIKESEEYISLNTNEKGSVCYKTSFIENIDDAERVYAVRIDFRNGQKLYMPWPQQPPPSGWKIKLVPISAVNYDGMTLYQPQ